MTNLLNSGWFGKAMGFVAGVLWGLPDTLFMAACAAAGVLMGHIYDRSVGTTTTAVLLMDDQLPGLRHGSNSTDALLQFAFASLGAVAKARGRVSEASIGFAEEVMQRMQLAEADRQQAIAAFSRGKDPYADLETLARRFRRSVGGQSPLPQVAMELACAGARVDGAPDAATRSTLHRVRGMLGLSRRQFRAIETLVLNRATRMPPSTPDVADRRADEARTLLGISKDANAKELKRAYRRQMSRHHPDKVVGRGADEATVRAAETRAQQIVLAYELLQGLLVEDAEAN